MEKQPIKVQLVNRKRNIYQIKFPNLKIPVSVNEHLYHKMLQSPEYQFKSTNAIVRQSHSA